MIFMVIQYGHAVNIFWKLYKKLLRGGLPLRVKLKPEEREREIETQSVFYHAHVLFLFIYFF